MSAVEMRPTFTVVSALSVDEALHRIREAFGETTGQGSGDRYHAQYTGTHAMIAIHEADRHFWSPWLTLEVRESEDQPDGREISGRFSPHPTVWTAIMFIYLALAIVIFFAAILGMSQRVLGHTTWGCGVIPGCLVIATALWLFSKAGQKLAHDEMQRMQSRLHTCLERA